MERSTESAAWLELDATLNPPKVRVGGTWTVAHAAQLDSQLERFVEGCAADGIADRLVVDASAVDTLDSVGAWLLHRTVSRLHEMGVDAELRGVSTRARTIYDQVARVGAPRPQAPPHGARIVVLLRTIGARVESFGLELKDLLAFFGRAVAVQLWVLPRPGRWRFTSLVHHLERAGYQSLPIVGLISFLIGVVLAFQGAAQLERFGANVFVVDLIAISILRELGVLLTAIIVAGRSGSAFTAELGSMQINEEVHALRTMGLDPVEVLVLPRVLALVISLPLLTFFADILGILGGGLLSWSVLDISPQAFLDRLRQAVGMRAFMVGIAKAPVFAAVIALVGCAQGLRVRGSAESLGRNTTSSVVQSISLVIVLDALFSIFFNIIGI